MSDRLSKTEIPLATVIVPLIEQTFVGLTPTHLESILGRKLDLLHAVPDEYWVDTGMIDLRFMEGNSKDQIASFRSSYEPEPVERPFAFLSINARQGESDGEERGFRLGWFNAVFGESPFTELRLKTVQIMPIKGEAFTNAHVARRRAIRSTSASIDRWPGAEGVHEVRITNLGGKLTSLSFNGKPLPIEFEEADGNIGLRGHADGDVFVKPFSLVLPRQISLNPNKFQEMHRLISGK